MNIDNKKTMKSYRELMGKGLKQYFPDEKEEIKKGKDELINKIN